MAGSLLEPGEKAFLQALDELQVPYLIVGLGAAVLQGAPLVTQDLDLWFEDRTDHRLHELRNVPGAYSFQVTSA